MNEPMQEPQVDSRIKLRAEDFTKPADDYNSKLLQNETMKRELLNALISGALSDKESNAARALLDSMDKSLFTQQRLEQDKKADSDSNAMLMALYQQLVGNNGRNFELDHNNPNATSADRSLDIIEGEFSFEDDETIIGLDTENSFG